MLRRALLALAIALAPVLAACGPDNSADEPDVRKAILEVFRCAATKDRDGVAALVNGREAMGYANPGSVARWDTEEGRKEVMDGHYRSLRLIAKDAGIVAAEDIPRLDANLKVTVNSRPSGTARAHFEVPAAKQLRKQKVVLTLQKGDSGWKVSGYRRDFVD
jgi:hypothetical protein